jgi:hypothetical protein
MLRRRCCAHGGDGGLDVDRACLFEHQASPAPRERSEEVEGDREQRHGEGHGVRADRIS